MKRILVTGSREATEEDHGGIISITLARALDLLPGDWLEQATLVEGGARGADAIAKRYWEWNGRLIESHPADWEAHGKAAGMIRNKHMVSLGADLCVAFPIRGLPNKGTLGCVREAMAAQIDTWVVWL